PTQAAQDVACTWLQRLLESSRSAKCAVWQRLEGQWWLIRLQREAATDAVGRPRAFAWLACAGPTLDSFCAFNALYDSVMRVTVSRDAQPPTSLATEPTLVPLDREELAHTLAACCGESLAVRRIDLATAVLSQLAPETFEWFGFFPDDALRSPTGLQGIVAAKQPSPCDPRYYELVDLCGVNSLIDLSLAGLRLLPLARDEKLRLVRIALGKEQLPPGVTLTPDTIQWLARTPAGRRAVLGALTPAQVVEWLRSSLAEYADLAALRDRLTDASRGDVVRLLSVRPDGFVEYKALYPHDAEGLFRLLAPAHQATYLALEAGQTPHSAAIAALWDVVGSTAIRRSFNRVAQISSAMAGVPAAREDLAITLSFDGWPLPVTRALLLGEQLGAAPTTAPPVSASNDWMSAVDGERLAACEPWAVGDGAWRQWWLANLEALARAGRLSTSRLFDIGFRLRIHELVELGGAPPAVVAVIRGVGSLTLPLRDDEWHPGADALVAKGIRDGSFWSH
ncbi:MAG TPA: hypothetical protein PLV92_22535, partial [Pirellulaceae bacterium]|nr:hypothetical protein [Pirellulaceae bacterium]